MIDTHAHLSDKVYDNVAVVIKRAKQDGVKKIITVGYDNFSSEKGQAISDEYSGIFFTAGIHPSECQRLDNGAIDRLLPLFSHKKCLAVGEIGLDYHYGKDCKDEQKELFISQLKLAKRVDLPVVIHSREATQDMLEILTANKDCLPNGFLMHCYSESAESAKEYLKLGAYFAFGGAITFKNAKKEDVIKSIPKDRILCETDCPYMSPVPYRGQVNEPNRVALVYQKLAKVYEEEIEEVILRVRANAVRFFNCGALGE